MILMNIKSHDDAGFALISCILLSYGTTLIKMVLDYCELKHEFPFPVDFIAYMIWELFKFKSIPYPKLPEGLLLILFLKYYLHQSSLIHQASFLENVALGCIWPTRSSGYWVSLLVVSYSLTLEWFSYVDIIAAMLIVMFVMVFKYLAAVTLKLKKADADILILLSSYALLWIYEREKSLYYKGSYTIQHMDMSYDRIVQALAFSCYTIMAITLIGMTLHMFASTIRDDYRTQLVITIISGGLLAIFLSYIPASIINHRIIDLVIWMFKDVLLAQGGGRAWVCVIWIICILVSIPVAQRYAHRYHVVIVRKGFHIVAVMMFMPVTICYPDFMLMAYSVSLSTFVIIEFLRLYPLIDRHSDDIIAKMIRYINTYYMHFFDTRDRDDGMIMSHSYLILGCAIPLGYATIIELSSHHPLSYKWRIMRHVGWISVGIGDAAGAIIGKLYGRYQWIGSHKTIEGSIAAIMMMIISSIIIMILEGWKEHHDGYNSVYNQDNMWLLRCISITMIIVGVAEAFTKENDNIIMPLVACAAYSMLLGSSMSTGL